MMKKHEIAYRPLSLQWKIVKFYLVCPDPIHPTFDNIYYKRSQQYNIVIQYRVHIRVLSQGVQ